MTKINKIPKSIKFDSNTVTIIESLMELPEYHKRKFNNMIEFLVETHPKFINEKKAFLKGMSLEQLITKSYGKVGTNKRKEADIAIEKAGKELLAQKKPKSKKK